MLYYTISISYFGALILFKSSFVDYGYKERYRVAHYSTFNFSRDDFFVLVIALTNNKKSRHSRN